MTDYLHLPKRTEAEVRALHRKVKCPNCQTVATIIVPCRRAICAKCGAFMDPVSDQGGK